jgi:TDG/mug DNA glycosylase family protein
MSSIRQTLFSDTARSKIKCRNEEYCGILHSDNIHPLAAFVAFFCRILRFSDSSSRIVLMPKSCLPLLAGFPPVLDKNTRIMILGSFPGEASLNAQQYYAHPRNQFWGLLSVILNEDLVAQEYAQRLQTLKAHFIGVWDVIAACEREGSLDTAIRRVTVNDLAALKHQCPKLFRICFNGKTSGRFGPQFAAAGFETMVLPSSSPANAQFTFEQKLATWRDIIR